jgi:hypothetical protein
LMVVVGNPPELLAEQGISRVFLQHALHQLASVYIHLARSA